MKKCPKCGKQYDDSWGVCLKDGAKLESIGSPETTNFKNEDFVTSDPDEYRTFINLKVIKLRLKEQSIDRQCTTERRGDAIIVLGLPCSNKRTFIEKSGLSISHVVIDADDAKEFIPEYKEDKSMAMAVHVKSVRMADELLFNEALRDYKHIALTRIGVNPEMLKELIQGLKDVGYKVTLIYNSLPALESMKRSAKRFFEGGIFFDVKYIQKIGSVPERSYKVLKMYADEYIMYDVNVPYGKEIILIEKGSNPKLAMFQGGDKALEEDKEKLQRIYNLFFYYVEKIARFLRETPLLAREKQTELVTKKGSAGILFEIAIYLVSRLDMAMVHHNQSHETRKKLFVYISDDLNEKVGQQLDNDDLLKVIDNRMDAYGKCYREGKEDVFKQLHFLLMNNIKHAKNSTKLEIWERGTGPIVLSNDFEDITNTTALAEMEMREVGAFGCCLKRLLSDNKDFLSLSLFEIDNRIIYGMEEAEEIQGKHDKKDE